MKGLIALLLASWCSVAKAEPYFRTVWINASPKPGIGSLLEVKDLKKTDGALALPIITHSHKDGYVLIPGEDWSLLTVGIGGTQGNISLAAGPAYNVLPVMQIGALGIMDYLNPTGDGFKPLRAFLSPASGAANQVSISAGPQFVFKPWDGPHGHGYLRIWTGAAYQF